MVYIPDKRSNHFNEWLLIVGAKSKTDKNVYLLVYHLIGDILKLREVLYNIFTTYGIVIFYKI